MIFLILCVLSSPPLKQIATFGYKFHQKVKSIHSWNLGTAIGILLANGTLANVKQAEA